MLILLAVGREASCAPRPAQQFQHFAAPRPLQPGHTLVLGFMGGRDSWRNAEVGVGRTAQWLRKKAMPGVHVETVENLKRNLALRLVRACLDGNGDGRLQPEERQRARIVLYGQSFGGAAVVKFARQLDRLGVPVLLTIQVDSVGQGDGLIPPNVRAAANYPPTTSGPIQRNPTCTCSPAWRGAGTTSSRFRGSCWRSCLPAGACRQAGSRCQP